MWTCSLCGAGFRVECMTECVKNPKHCPFCASGSIKSAHATTSQERRASYDTIAKKTSEELHGRVTPVAKKG